MTYHLETYESSVFARVIEDNRKANEAYDMLVDACTGKSAPMCHSNAASLDAALAKIEQEWAEKPEIKWNDRPEDLALDAIRKWIK